MSSNEQMPLIAYHGFSKGKTNVFHPYAYFAFTKEDAEIYDAGDGIGVFHLNLKTPLILDTPEKVKSAFDITNALSLGTCFYPDSQMILNKWAESLGHDGIIVSESAFEGELGFEWVTGTFGHSQVVVFRPELITVANR